VVMRPSYESTNTAIPVTIIKTLLISPNIAAIFASIGHSFDPSYLFDALHSKSRGFNGETGLVTLSATPFAQYEGNYDEGSDSPLGRLCPYWSSDFVTNITYQNQHED